MTTVGRSSDGGLLGTIVLNYNNTADTIACVDSLLEAGATAAGPLLVVDNNSDQPQREELHAWAMGRKVLRVVSTDELPHAAGNGRWPTALVDNATNSGYGGGNNLAIRMLLRRPPTWIWILNNDTVVPTASFIRLRAALEAHQGDALVLGTRIHVPGTADGDDTLGGGCYKPLLGRAPVLRASSVQKDPRAVDRLTYISGASSVIRSDVFQRCGLLVESHFLFWEELDYADRVRAAGIRLGVLPEVTVLHHQGRASGAGADFVTPSAAYYSTRAALFYVRRHQPKWIAATLIARVLYAVRSLALGQVQKAWQVTRGLCAGLTQVNEPAPVA